MTTYLQYVSRDNKIGDIQKDEDLAWMGPVGLGTNRRLTEAFKPKNGDLIYLASSLAGFSLPSIDARIVINQDYPLYPERCEALGKAKEHVFAAGAGSRWLPMLDASSLLECLEATTGRVLGKQFNATGRALTVVQRLQGARTIRRLTDRSAGLVARWDGLEATKPVFISYRSTNGKRLAAATAKQLARSGIPVWYDQWSISIRLDEIDKRNADEQLLENIRDQMGRCSAVVQLMTPGFGESHWTRLERQWAADQLTYRISSESELAVLLQRLRESRTEKPSRSRSPKNRRHLP